MVKFYNCTVLARSEAALPIQRGSLFPWTPVCLPVEVGWYFGLRVEPGVELYGSVLSLPLVCVVAV